MQQFVLSTPTDAEGGREVLERPYSSATDAPLKRALELARPAKPVDVVALEPDGAERKVARVWSDGGIDFARPSVDPYLFAGDNS